MCCIIPNHLDKRRCCFIINLDIIPSCLSRHYDIIQGCSQEGEVASMLSIAYLIISRKPGTRVMQHAGRVRHFRRPVRHRRIAPRHLDDPHVRLRPSGRPRHANPVRGPSFTKRRGQSTEAAGTGSGGDSPREAAGNRSYGDSPPFCCRNPLHLVPVRLLTPNHGLRRQSSAGGGASPVA